MADRARFFAVLAAWGATCMAWSISAQILRLVLPNRLREPVGRGGIRFGFRFLLWLMQRSGLCKFELSALDALDRDRALLIAANHPGLLDAVLVAARVPRTVCITKAALWNNPFLGGGIRLAGYLRNDSPLALVRSGIGALRGGRHLLVFPEGTRTASGHKVDGFRGGFALMAKGAGVSVQTVLIETDNPYLCKGWPLFRMPPLPIRYSVRLGRRFRVDGDVRRFVSELELYFRTELQPGSGPREPPQRGRGECCPELARQTELVRGLGRVHEPA